MPECRTVLHPVSPVPEWTNIPSQSGTGIRGTSPVPKCPGTGLRYRKLECLCRRHRPRCRCPALPACFFIVNSYILLCEWGPPWTKEARGHADYEHKSRPVDSGPLERCFIGSRSNNQSDQDTWGRQLGWRDWRWRDCRGRLKRLFFAIA
jgi:hypothetical protein